MKSDRVFEWGSIRFEWIWKRFDRVFEWISLRYDRVLMQISPHSDRVLKQISPHSDRGFRAAAVARVARVFASF